MYTLFCCMSVISVVVILLLLLIERERKKNNISKQTDTQIEQKKVNKNRSNAEKEIEYWNSLGSTRNTNVSNYCGGCALCFINDKINSNSEYREKYVVIYMFLVYVFPALQWIYLQMWYFPYLLCFILYNWLDQQYSESIELLQSAHFCMHLHVNEQEMRNKI